MAEREDIEGRIRKANPRAVDLCREIDKALRQGGYQGQIVTTTEDMSAAEQELAIYEGLLKEGKSPDEAEQLAKEWVAALSTCMHRR